MPKRPTRDRRQGDRRTGPHRPVKEERRRGPTRVGPRRVDSDQDEEFEFREPAPRR